MILLIDKYGTSWRPEMSELRPAKMLSSTLLICSGAVCLTIGGLPSDENARSSGRASPLRIRHAMLVRQ